MPSLTSSGRSQKAVRAGPGRPPKNVPHHRCPQPDERGRGPGHRSGGRGTRRTGTRGGPSPSRTASTWRRSSSASRDPTPTVWSPTSRSSSERHWRMTTESDSAEGPRALAAAELQPAVALLGERNREQATGYQLRSMKSRQQSKTCGRPIATLWPKAADPELYALIAGEAMKQVAVDIDPPVVLAPEFEPWFNDAVVSGQIKLERWYSYKQFLTHEQGFRATGARLAGSGQQRGSGSPRRPDSSRAPGSDEDWSLVTSSRGRQRPTSESSTRPPTLASNW